MATFLSRLFARSSRPARTTNRRRKSVQLGVEKLDDRIVPAGVTYHGGAIIPNVQVEPIFYGSSWSSNLTLAIEARTIASFWQNLTNSSYMDELGQYFQFNYSGGSFAGLTYVGHGSAHSADIPGFGPTSGTVYDNPSTAGAAGIGYTIQDLIREEMLAGRVDWANQNTLYIVYLAPGAQFINGTLTSSGFYGYHGPSGSNDGYFTSAPWLPSFNYAVTSYPGATPSATVLPTMTWQSTHEFAEAVTDPDLKTGWFGVNAQDEIGDRANTQVGNLNGYNVEYQWSNVDNATALWEPWGQHVLYRANSVPYLVGSTFQFTLGKLQVQGENFNTGAFWGVYTNRYGVSISVTGGISGTTTSGGTTTSSITFQGNQNGFLAQFSGTLTGTGAVNPSGWKDTMTGGVWDYFTGNGGMQFLDFFGTSGTDF
jgi:hypothetical protein